jgi:hypothetical protein
MLGKSKTIHDAQSLEVFRNDLYILARQLIGFSLRNLSIRDQNDGILDRFFTAQKIKKLIDWPHDSIH